MKNMENIHQSEYLTINSENRVELIDDPEQKSWKKFHAHFCCAFFFFSMFLIFIHPLKCIG